MNIGLILSGGTGARLGAETPKQYLTVASKPIILYAVEALAAHPQIDAIQIVADPLWQPQIFDWLDDAAKAKFRGFALPGTNRQLSIVHGLEAICEYAGEADRVLIHDAARPCLPAQQIADCLSALDEHDGALPVLPMKDTVYLSENGKTVTSLLDRKAVFAGQAPEAFRLEKYLAANRRLLPDAILSINGSTEPAILAGLDVALIPGDERNFKITTMADLERFRQEMERK